MRQRLFARRWRRTLATLGVAVLAVGALAAGGAVWLYQDAKQSNVGELAFTNRLALPELAEPTIDEDGRKVFDLRFMAGETELADAGPTDTWGLNGTYLGPTLRAARGDRVRVNVTNDVDEATTLHWHGMHLPARMDGGPHQMIDPGETWSPAWTIDQPAASLWFHPHLHGATADHVYRGAAGMFIVDDPTRDIELPDTYGVDDIPLIIQDKRFDDDGSLAHSAPFASTTGILGDTILVNGTYDPYVEATTTLVRFRVVNASNARVYNLGFTDDRRFWQVGSDSGLLERPHETQLVQVAPGERAEIVVPIEPGDEAVLLGGHERPRQRAQLPSPPRALRRAGRGREPSPARAVGLEGHDLRAAPHDHPDHRPLRRRARPGHAVHVPVPHARPRGRRHDGPVRDRRAP
jgi:FtsP/CotA-like multicopper oxidase with cupredoxin domain